MSANECGRAANSHTVAKHSPTIQSMGAIAAPMKRLLASLAITAFAAWPLVHAQGFGSSFDASQARDAVRSGKTVSLKRINNDLLSRYGGEMLSADLFSLPGGKSEYRIMWLTVDGRRMALVVDGQNGRVISEREG